MHASTAIALQSIATVHHTVPDDQVAKRRRDLVADIVVRPEFADGLHGIDQYSHLMVIFWMDRAHAPETLRCHPRGDTGVPAVGVFAARGRNHPNPLGLAVVELLAVDGARLRVRRLDAFDGTPVLDIKPYDDYDSVPAPRVPEWFRARARGRTGDNTGG